MRNLELIKSAARSGDFGAAITVMQEASADFDRIFQEMKLGSDDLAGVSGARGLKTVRRIRTTNQSIPSGGNIAWTETVFEEGDWNPGGDSIQVPAGVTRVIVTGGAQWEANSTGNRECCILVASSVAVLTRIRAVAVGDHFHSVTTGMINVVPGQFISLRVVQDSGGALDIKPDQSFLTAVAVAG